MIVSKLKRTYYHSKAPAPHLYTTALSFHHYNLDGYLNVEGNSNYEGCSNVEGFL